MRSWFLIALFVAACGKSGETEKRSADPAVGSAGSAAAAPTPPPPSPTPPPAESPPAASAPSAKIKAARCGEPCLFLIDTPYAQLVDTYRAQCGGMETKDLGYDDCKKLDYMRNCIYAAHGMVFKKQRWKVYATKPWYDAHAEFDPKTIGELERANVHELNQRGKACKKGLSITGGDYDRITAWWKVLPKVPPMPKVVIYDDQPVTGPAFVKALLGMVAGEHGKPRKLSRGKVFAEYINPDDPPAEDEPPASLVSAVKAVKPPPRLVYLYVEVVAGEEYSKGAVVWFAYDHADKLFAVAAAEYEHD